MKDKFGSILVKMIRSCFTSYKLKPEMFPNVKSDVLSYKNNDDFYNKLKVLYPYDYSTKLPLIIDIHGGGWMYGDYDTNIGINTFLASKGYVVISMNYHLLPEYKLNTMVDDIYNSIKYIKTLDYNIDFDNIYLMGDSGGAQLALVFKTINDNLELREKLGFDYIDISFKGLVLNHPALDINHVVKLKLGSKIFRRTLYGKNYKENELYKYTSIEGLIPYVKNDTPIYMITSKGDWFVGPEMKNIRRCFDKYEINYDLYYEASKMFHVFNITEFETEEAKKCNQSILNFLANALKKQNKIGSI